MHHNQAAAIVDSAGHPVRTRSPYIRIRPGRRPLATTASEVYEFRDLLFVLAMRDLKLRFRQTMLGVAWVIFQPVLAAGIFTVVFGMVANLKADGAPYYVFSFAGLLAWNAFSATLTRASGSLVGHAHLISKVYFPRVLLPLSTALTTLIDFAISAFFFAVLMVVHGLAPSASLLLLPVWLTLLITMALGLGLLGAALSVSYRDVQYVIPVLVPLLMYASPVGYAVGAVPAEYRVLFWLNPLTGLLEAFRWSLLGSGHVDLTLLAYSSAVSAGVCVAGVFFFQSTERRFADVI